MTLNELAAAWERRASEYPSDLLNIGKRQATMDCVSELRALIAAEGEVAKAQIHRMKYGTLPKENQQ